MSKRYKQPPVDFLDFLDKQDREGSIPLDVGDKRFYVRSAVLLTDEQAKLANSDDGDELELARSMVDDYDGLCAALAEHGHPGGAAMAIMAIVGEQAQQIAAGQGADVGESEGSTGS
jgi:hypothetical protein